MYSHLAIYLLVPLIRGLHNFLFPGFYTGHIRFCRWKRKPSLRIEHFTTTVRPCVTSRKDQNLPSALLDLIKEMSDDGLYIPESSITLRSIVGKGEVDPFIFS